MGCTDIHGDIRPRAVTHITIGDENWKPTPEEIDTIKTTFETAPVGDLTIRTEPELTPNALGLSGISQEDLDRLVEEFQKADADPIGSNMQLVEPKP